MNVEFGWFLPTMGDSEVIGPPTRPATLEYLVDVAKAAEDAGFSFALVPVGTTCQDAWLCRLSSPDGRRSSSSSSRCDPGSWLRRLPRRCRIRSTSLPAAEC